MTSGLLSGVRYVRLSWRLLKVVVHSQWIQSINQ